MPSQAYTWRKGITGALREAGENWDDVVAKTLTEKELDVEFFQGFGSAEGIPFTVWTATRVYFPTEYDGYEGVASAPRNPCDEKMSHV